MFIVEYLAPVGSARSNSPGIIAGFDAFRPVGNAVVCESPTNMTFPSSVPAGAAVAAGNAAARAARRGRGSRTFIRASRKNEKDI